jgi:hypothetical protein
VLQREIKAAKDRSWKELIEAVESDPRGKPYKVVLAKLRPQAPHRLRAWTRKSWTR